MMEVDEQPNDEPCETPLGEKVDTKDVNNHQDTASSELPNNLDTSTCKSFPGLASTSASLVRGIYLYPDSCDLETLYIVLIQDECVSIWWRESDSTTEWNLVSHTIDEEPTNLNCSVIESKQFIWIGLIYDGLKYLTLTHLRFDKIAKNVKLYLREFFASTFISAEMINKCQLRRATINIACLPNEKSVLSIPGPSNTIKIFLYDLPTSSKTYLTSINARNVTTSCILPVDDWDIAFIAHFDNRIQIWNTNDKSLINSIHAERSIFENKICFDVMHDKGLVYLFIGDPRSSAIDVIALNPKTGRYASLMSCNIFETDVTNPLSFNKIKRSGNQLLLVKDDGVVLYDLANSKSVLNCGQTSIKDASIGFVKDKAVIFAATTYGKIINLLNS